MKYLELATRIAQDGIDEQKNAIFGAVAVRRDGLIVCSKNVRTKEPHKAAHAEARVLTKAGFGATLYVVRINRKGEWSLAKPCLNCEVFLKNKKCDRIYYSIAPNEYGCLTF